MRKTRKLIEAINILSDERILDCDPVILERYLHSHPSIKIDMVYRVVKMRGWVWSQQYKRWVPKFPAWIYKAREWIEKNDIGEDYIFTAVNFKK